jgi:hypothetical protein
MFLMAEQYSRELLVEIDGRQAPSPVMRFWRESLQRLSPSQMREGLRLYMKSERGSYKPNPEDIVHNAVDVPAPVQIKDRPVKRMDPNCPECGGSGFRQVEVKSRTRPGSKIKAVADCYCVRIDYAGKTFTSTGKLLQERSDDHPSPPTPGGLRTPRDHPSPPTPGGLGTPDDHPSPPTPGGLGAPRDRVVEGKHSTRGSERSECAAYDVVEERPLEPALSEVEGAALGGKNQLGFSPGADPVADNVVKPALAGAKTMPRTKPLNDAEYNQRRQMLERQKETLLEKSGDRVIR